MSSQKYWEVPGGRGGSGAVPGMQEEPWKAVSRCPGVEGAGGEGGGVILALLFWLCCFDTLCCFLFFFLIFISFFFPFV